MDDDLPFPHPRRRPTQSEIVFHKGLIERLERDIESTQDETRLQRLQKAKDNHASYIAPLRRLPTELLSEIVYMCLQDGASRMTLTQTCGALRDVIIGMSALWTKIFLESTNGHSIFRYQGTFHEFIRCRDRDHLDLLLTRAATRHLCVCIEYPIASDMLEPLSSRKTAINSLGIDYNYSPCSDYVHKDDLKDFNMESLEELVLKGLSCEEAEAILDLALHSTCDEMKVGLDIHSIKPVLFEHSLIRRSAQLDISAPELEGQILPSSIHLPHIKSLHMNAGQDLLDAFDIRNSKLNDLAYWCNDEYLVDPDSLPSQLGSLHLSSVSFTHKPSHPDPLVQLTMLSFGDATLEHPLQDYIALPNLKQLEIWNVIFDPSDDEYLSAPCNAKQMFLREAPKLETISIQHMEIDCHLATVLESCPLLESMTIEECNADFFFLYFKGSLRHEDSFPSLETFCIMRSWPWKLSLSHDEFVAFCADKRPDITISGDNEWY